jgi:hypothetical protein
MIKQHLYYDNLKAVGEHKKQKQKQYLPNNKNVLTDPGGIFMKGRYT